MLNIKIRKNRNLVIVISIITMVITLFLTWFFVKTLDAIDNGIKLKLKSSSQSIEQSFKDNISHTEFLMKLINEQVKKNPNDKLYIYDILAKYKVSPNVENSLSWTLFTWADSNHMVVAEAASGLVEKPYSLSKRDYVPITKLYPNMLHIGKPVLGIPSGRWVVPGGVGAADQLGNYIGATTVGFDLNQMSRQLEILKNSENIEFLIFDKKKNLLIDSSRAKQGPENIASNNAVKALENYVANRNYDAVFYSDIVAGKESYLLKKFDELPFYIYIKYDQAAIKAEFWEAVTSRLVELIIIGIIAIFIAAYIHSRERKLRYKAEDSYQMALAASRGKSEFLAYTGHELRSPLNVIIFGSEMMKSQVFGDLPPKYLEYAEDIYQNGNDLLQFIEDLMDVTKADEEGSFSLKSEYVDVNEVIERVIKLNITRATKHKVRLEKLADVKLPKLWADPRRLRQILNNLLSNAIKYSPENTKVRIIAHAIDGVMQIVVEDEGFGMDAQQLDIAMRRYGTVQNENSDKVESIGLGLPLVKQLVDAHHGKFDIESKPNQGTKVTLTFKIIGQS